MTEVKHQQIQSAQASSVALAAPKVIQTKNLVRPSRIILAVVFSLSLLIYYLHDQDWFLIAHAAQQANLYLAFAAVFVLVLNMWLFEVYFRGSHFIWFHGSFPWHDYFWMSGALFLILLINGPLSGAARVLYVVKKTQATWTLYFGIALFRIILRAGSLALVMIPLTFFVYDLPVFANSRFTLIYWFVFIVWNLGVLADFYFVFFHQKYFGFSRLVKHKLQHELFKPFQMATRFQWLWTMTIGFIPFCIFIACYWVMAYAFGIVIPLFYFMICFIFVLLLSNLPLSFGGFGTTTMAWMLFFSDYASEANLLSFTLFLPLALLLIQGLVGVFCLKPALGDLGVLLEEARQKNQRKEKEASEIKNIFLNKR